MREATEDVTDFLRDVEDLEDFLREVADTAVLFMCSHKNISSGKSSADIYVGLSLISLLSFCSSCREKSCFSSSGPRMGLICGVL